MIKIIGAPTQDDALAALADCVAENEARGESNFIFCEDRLTLLAERAVLKKSGGTFLTEVSTFARFLSGAQRTLSKQGSVMALSAILSSCEKELRCFRKGSAQAVYETIAQLSASRVDAETLRESAAGTDGLLKEKLSDLALLLEKYEAFLSERGLLDENGYLALLPEKISSGALKDKNVFFVAFPSFTAQAREGVRAALESAKSVTGIFLAGGEDFYTNEGITVFSALADEYGGADKSAVPTSLTSDALTLSKGLFSPEKFKEKSVPAEQVYAFSATDEAEEFNTVCALIKKYIAEGMRYRDFTVLVNGNFTAAEKAMTAYRIPFFSDRRRGFDLHPFCAFVLSVLDAAANGALPESIDAVASSAYFGTGDNYRNYLLKYGGFRGAVKREIKEGEAVENYDRAELISCREKMLGILSLMPSSGTGAAYAAAVRALYEYVDGERVTEELRAGMEGAEREFLDLAPLESVLAETESLAGDRRFTAREFTTLFASGISALEISVIPQYADAVYLGDVSESKPSRAKVLFCTGLTGDLPRVSSDAAVITDGDIKKLSRLSVEIEPAIAVVNSRARENMALNLCAFQTALYLSRPLRNAEKETAESEALTYVKQLFKTRSLPDLFPYDCSEKEPAALGLLALREDFEAGRSDDGGKFFALREALVNSGELCADILAGSEKTQVPAAGKLWLSREISPTLLENYFTCPYEGFALKGLRLREREERTVLDTDAGTFVHAVLERVAKKFNVLASEEACRAEAEAAGRELLLTARFSSLSDTGAGAYTAERLVGEGVAVSAAAYRQLAGSSFRVSETEGVIRIPELSLYGKTDRIDRAGEYVRVIDYKTGAIDDSPVAYYTGRKLQLGLYLLATSREGKAAGAFYFPAADDFVKEGEEKFRMKGFFSKEDAVLALMDSSRKEGEKSRFFEGGGRTEKGMMQEDFEKFLDYAYLVSARAEEEMRAGNVAPSPYEGACDYCKCKGMCGFTGRERKEHSLGCGEIVNIVRRERGEEE